MSRDPPQRLDNRTVIRSAPVVGPEAQQTPALAEPTVLLGAVPDIGGGWIERTVIAGATATPTSSELDELFATEPSGTVFSGPLMALAAPVLIPLARLLANPAIGAAETRLHARFEAVLRGFDRAASAAGLQPDDARLAQRTLAVTIEDVVGHLPGIDLSAWRRQGPFPGVGSYNLFDGLNRILAEPERHRELVRLHHACLALGFQGQYRGRPSANAELDHIRSDVYRVLQQLIPSPSQDEPGNAPSADAAISRRRLPLASIGLVAIGAVVAATFGGMNYMLTSESEMLEAELLALNPAAPVVIAETIAPAPAETAISPSPPRTQPSKLDALLDRARSQLGNEIAAGGVTLRSSGNELAIEINNSLLFAAGSASLKDSFAPIAERVGNLLHDVEGQVRIVGYTDNLKPGKSSRFQSNEALSAARAEAVAKMLARHLDADRLQSEGRGEVDPIASNDTTEGREKNRRVVISLSLEAGQ